MVVFSTFPLSCGTDLEVLGHDHQRSLLVLQAKAGYTFNDQIIGTQFVLSQSKSQVPQLLGIFDLRKARTGQGESAVPSLGEIYFLSRENQTALA